MTKPVFIYCLWCPLAKRVRYVGKSNEPETRVYRHLVAASRGWYQHNTSRWLRKIRRLGLKPRLRILLQVPDGEDWAPYEMRVIAKALAKGWPLTNQTAGGEGVRFLTQEDLETAKVARRAGFTPEVLERMSQSMKEAWENPDFRARHRAAMIASCSTAERRARLSFASKCRTAAGEANRLAAVHAYWANPDNRKKQAEIARQKFTKPAWRSKRT